MRKSHVLKEGNSRAHVRVVEYAAFIYARYMYLAPRKARAKKEKLNSARIEHMFNESCKIKCAIISVVCAEFMQ